MKASNPRYGRYAGVAGAVILALAAIYLLFLRPAELSGIPPGSRVAPFAVPLALGSLQGDADIATRADQGGAGLVPACAERGAQILNICQLYEQGPVVLALFPSVRFAAVAVEGDRAALRRLLRSQRLTLPVGIDSDGAVGSLYKVLSCPQVNFAYPGGVVQSPALLSTPSRATLRARVQALVAASQARARGAPAP
jgi:hypothetical protein